MQEHMHRKSVTRVLVADDHALIRKAVIAATQGEPDIGQGRPVNAISVDGKGAGDIVKIISHCYAQPPRPGLNEP